MFYLPHIKYGKVLDNLAPYNSIPTQTATAHSASTGYYGTYIEDFGDSGRT